MSDQLYALKVGSTIVVVCSPVVIAVKLPELLTVTCSDDGGVTF